MESLATHRRLKIAPFVFLAFVAACIGPAIAQELMSGAPLARSFRPNVVAIEVVWKDKEMSASEGFGLIVGMRDDEFLIATANHVVRSKEISTTPEAVAETIKLRLYQRRGETFEGKLLNVFSDTLDLAVIAARLPADIEWETHVLAPESSQIELDAKVWFVGKAREWQVFGAPGTVGDIEWENYKIIVDGLGTRVGSSGGLLVSADGIIGMIRDHEGQSERTYATPIKDIRRKFFEDWSLPWVLSELTPQPPMAPAAPKPSPPDVRTTAWTTATKRNTFAAYQDFLNRYCGNDRRRFCIEAGEALKEQEMRVPGGVTDCDRYAASPTDRDRVAPGVKQEDFELQHAHQACRRAVIDEDPDNPRLMYQYGRVLDEEGDHEQAAAWFMRAADKDYPAAHVDLAVLYAVGEGVRKDHAKALASLKKAAEYYSDPSAQMMLGKVYRDALFGKEDLEQAHRWFQKAAEQGHPEAQLALGRLYEEGQDFSQAEHWYERAAAQGFVEAERRLKELPDG